MIRYSFYALALIATAATAIAAATPKQTGLVLPAHNLTVIAKNQDFPIYGPITVTACAKEDCSDTQD